MMVSTLPIRAGKRAPLLSVTMIANGRPLKARVDRTSDEQDRTQRWLAEGEAHTLDQIRHRMRRFIAAFLLHRPSDQQNADEGQEGRTTLAANGRPRATANNAPPTG